MAQAAKTIRIDPNVIRRSAQAAPSLSSLGKSKAASFGDVMSVATIAAPIAGEAGFHLGGESAATVLFTAFNNMGHLGAAAGQGGGLGGGMGMGATPGAFGASSHAGLGAGTSGYGYGGSSIPGMDGMDQASLLNQMNQNNLQLLELQAIMQNNMQQWTTKSNVLKATHDAKMAMIQHFAVRG
jgi:hypothetical protein